MAERINVHEVAPDAYKAMGALQHFVSQSSLPRTLLELVKMRASQLNGCAYCLDMHSKDVIALGMPAQMLFLLDAWREAPFYREKERAALEWTEAVTMVAETRVPDEVYEAVRNRFSECHRRCALSASAFADLLPPVRQILGSEGGMDR